MKVEFKTLEDLDTLINVAGANMPVARYIIGVTFHPGTVSSATTSATPKP